MRLTPLDIRKQEFTRSFRGYEPEEVQAFLQMISKQWEELQDDQRRLSERLREMESKLTHYEKVEEALQEALQTARESSRKALANAEEKAKLMLEEAERRAEDIRREAERDRHDIKREVGKLKGRRNEIAARLRAFLMSEMEMLARFEGDDPIGFIKLLPMEEQRLRERKRSLPPREEHGPREGQEDATTAPAGETQEPRADAADGARAPEPTADREAFRAEEEEEGAPPRREQPREAESQQEVKQGPGWTARTVVSSPAAGRRAEGARAASPGDAGDDEGVSASDEEIAKIRRILSDLD